MFSIDLRSRIPIYEQIKNQIMEYIRIGIFSPNDQLPSIRSVAADAGLNVNTVKRAFMELESDGIIYTLVGKGSFVCETAFEERHFREKALAELTETIRTMRSKGITREEILSVVNSIYIKEEEDNG